MAEEGKKISFGFSKSIKKPVLRNVPVQEVKKVDFIECLDEKAIKVIGDDERKDEPLVIPMLGSRTWHDRILNRVDADIFEPKGVNEGNAGENERVEAIPNGRAEGEVEVKKEPVEEVKLSLEEQAAREILGDLGTEVKVEERDFTVPVAEADNLVGQQESTLEDYEQIPIESFGLAMLRGMGWKPGKGIGKNEQLVAPKLPELRPRGMGLGADKAVLKKKNAETKTKEEEQLKLVVGAFVKITGGKHEGNYGQLEGLDDDTGRIIVKLAIGGETISLNESLVELITKSEYSKNSKVLNASKYEEYRSRDRKTESPPKKRKSEDSSSSSSDERHEKRSKKKHKSREKSSSKRKSKKKEKTRDRSRDRSNYSESLDRRKSRKHRRRSRS